LTKLYEASTGDRRAFVDEKDAELKLREKLENRDCLRAHIYNGNVGTILLGPAEHHHGRVRACRRRRR
jgi:hypothetical protein